MLAVFGSMVPRKVAMHSPGNPGKCWYRVDMLVDTWNGNPRHISTFFWCFSPNNLLLGVLSSFFRCVRLFVTGGVRLSGLVCVLSPFICLPSCVSLSGGVRLSGLVCALVSLHLSAWVVVSASPVLSVPCILSFVSLHLSPFMCLHEWWCPPLRSCLCLVSLYLSPFMCLPEWWCPPRRSCLCLVSLDVSPWVVVSASPVLSVPCLPSCVSLSGGVRLAGLVCALVSLHLSPFMCLPEWWCPPLRSCLYLVSLYLSPFICLPEWWCPPLRSCLCLVSLHVSPWVVVSASPVLSVPCLPSCVSLSGGVRLSGLVCALSPFICLPSCVSLSCGVRLSGLVFALSPFICRPEWWCPPRRSCLCLCLVSLHLSPFMCFPEWWCPPLGSCLCLVSLHLSPFMCLPEWWCPPLRSCLCLVSFHLSPFICLPSCVSMSGGVRLSGLVCALFPFMCLPEWWCPPLRSCLCLVSLHLSPIMCLPELWCPPLRSCLRLSWMVCLLSRNLLSHILFLLVSLCWMVCPLYRLVSPCFLCLPLPPIVCHCLPTNVSPPSRGLVSPCVPSCFPLLDGASAVPLLWIIFHSLPFCFPFLGGVPSRGLVPLVPQLVSQLVSQLARLSFLLVPFGVRLPACFPSCFRFLDGARVFPRPCLPACLPAGLCSCFPLLGGVSVFPLVSHVSILFSLCWMVCPPSQVLVPFVSQLVYQFVFLLVSLCWRVRPPSYGLVSFVSQLGFQLVSQLAPQLVSQLVSPLFPSKNVRTPRIAQTWKFTELRDWKWCVIFHFHPSMFSTHPIWQSYAACFERLEPNTCTSIGCFLRRFSASSVATKQAKPNKINVYKVVCGTFLQIWYVH